VVSICDPRLAIPSMVVQMTQMPGITRHLVQQQSRGFSRCEGSFHAICVRGPRAHTDVGSRRVEVCRVGTLTRGPVAQRIEQQPSKLKVAGSIPAGVAMISIT
jgi:hypothetical protein